MCISITQYKRFISTHVLKTRKRRKTYHYRYIGGYFLGIYFGMTCSVCMHHVRGTRIVATYLLLYAIFLECTVPIQCPLQQYYFIRLNIILYSY